MNGSHHRISRNLLFAFIPMCSHTSAVTSSAGAPGSRGPFEAKGGPGGRGHHTCSQVTSPPTSSVLYNCPKEGSYHILLINICTCRLSAKVICVSQLLPCYFLFHFDKTRMPGHPSTLKCQGRCARRLYIADMTAFPSNLVRLGTSLGNIRVVTLIKVLCH